MSMNRLSSGDSAGQQMDDLRHYIDKSIDDCVSVVTSFVNGPTEETAEEACLACRSAVQLFFFGRGDYGENATDKTDKLTDALARAREACVKLGERLGPNSIVWKYQENMLTRQSLVDAVIRDDVPRIRRLLKEAIQAS